MKSYLQKHPKEISKNSARARTTIDFCILEIVEHVGDPTGKGEHDNKERNQKHANIHHHSIDAKNDWTKVFGCDADLNHFDYGECVGYSPEYSPSRAQTRYVNILLTDDIFKKSNDKANHKESVHENVVVVPKCEVSFLNFPLIGIWSFKAP